MNLWMYPEIGRDAGQSDYSSSAAPPGPVGKHSRRRDEAQPQGRTPQPAKWIVFDAIASLPTSFFGCAGGGILEYVKFIRFTKLFKMLRMLKINSIVDTRHIDRSKHSSYL